MYILLFLFPGTPTHFIETYIDLNYHWNEWELRKRALKLVNLTKCKTIGQQTDHSHFRRENDSQVYELREMGTQTLRNKGTNPPMITTYLGGLRGTANTNNKAVSKYVSRGIKSVIGGGKVVNEEKDRDGDAKSEQLRARIVTLKLDL